MFEDFSALKGPYLHDVLNQPGALADTFESLESHRELLAIAARLRSNKFHRIVLTGMGSSFHALHPLNLELISQGYTSVMVETSELVHYKSRFFDPKTLIVAVSQSGKSAEMVRLARANKKRCTVIAVTNTPGSPLARHADAALFTAAGQEFSVSCKTYVTALMALSWLGELLLGRDLGRARHALKDAAPTMAEYLANWQEYVNLLSRTLTSIRHLFLVGRGASLAAVGTGALIVKESDHFHAEGMSSAAFRHGPFEMLGDETFVLVFAGDSKTRALNRRLVDDIRGQHGRTALVGSDAEPGPFRLAHKNAALRPILEILPVQMITLALAAQVGREPGRFELASKVTTRE